MFDAGYERCDASLHIGVTKTRMKEIDEVVRSIVRQVLFPTTRDTTRDIALMELRPVVCIPSTRSAPLQLL